MADFHGGKFPLYSRSEMEISEIFQENESIPPKGRGRMLSGNATKARGQMAFSEEKVNSSSCLQESCLFTVFFFFVMNHVYACF